MIKCDGCPELIDFTTQEVVMLRRPTKFMWGKYSYYHRGCFSLLELTRLGLDKKWKVTPVPEGGDGQ